MMNIEFKCTKIDSHNEPYGSATLTLENIVHYEDLVHGFVIFSKAAGYHKETIENYITEKGKEG